MVRELRRLLIDQERILSKADNSFIKLSNDEVHYLKNVLRLGTGDLFLITDGLGNLWQATFDTKNTVLLESSFEKPYKTSDRLKPLIGLAVAVPKRGMKEILRMSCEIGVDIIQPLISDRSIKQPVKKNHFHRWNYILNEATEQSERLWRPDLKELMSFHDWVQRPHSNRLSSIASTRDSCSNEFEIWLKNISKQFDEIWVVIGPEGGWSNQELTFALDNAYSKVQFGETILTTSTAAISASQLMASWRRTYI